MSRAEPCDAMVVLLVDERMDRCEPILGELRDLAQTRAYHSGDPEHALQTAQNLRPTVILHCAPRKEAFAFIGRYRADERTRGIPVVLFAAAGAGDAAVAFAAGASDYVTSSCAPGELIARLRYHSGAYTQRRAREEAYRTLGASRASLLKKNGELERLSSVDGLTGLSNRRYFDDFTAMQWKLAIRERHPFSILMVDVDDFKPFNDTYGHLAGDAVLKRVGEALRLCCQRPVDLVARFGGEEFVVSLRSPLEEAARVAERLCRAVERLAIVHAGSSVAGSVTVSIGGASTLPLPGEAYLPLLEAADVALYEAKSGGKNRALVTESRSSAFRVTA